MEKVLFYRDGGGYRFIHCLLLDYFVAAQESDM